MSSLLGAEIGNQYFSTPANPSRSAAGSQDKIVTSLADIPARKLRQLLQRKDTSLTSRQLLDDSLSESIHTIYAEDYELIRQINLEKHDH